MMPAVRTGFRALAIAITVVGAVLIVALFIKIQILKGA